MQPKNHWEHVYATKKTESVSWFQEHAEQSMRLIRGTGVPYSAGIIDVGGGASTLVDDLLSSGYCAVSVLDLAAAALSVAKARLGKRASEVQWTEGDITKVLLPVHAFDVWHDRAVFHFLTRKKTGKPMSTKCFDRSNLAVTSSSLPLPKMVRSNAVACQSCGTGRASCTPSSVRRFPSFGMNAKNTTHHSAQYRSLCTVTAESCPLEPLSKPAQAMSKIAKIAITVVLYLIFKACTEYVWPA